MQYEIEVKVMDICEGIEQQVAPFFEKYGKSQEAMYQALRAVYVKASGKLNTELIPCGDVIQALRRIMEFIRAADNRFAAKMVSICTRYMTDMRLCILVRIYPERQYLKGAASKSERMRIL